jgi:hypothetical protein
MLPIHKDIKNKLEQFRVQKHMPNILFHGPSGCGKSTLVNEFVNTMYSAHRTDMSKYIMFVDCSYGKGIKFIREDLKFFAKTNIHLDHGNIFKLVLLVNADKLTVDAQSALRRCMEVFSHTTRFFIIVEKREKMMNPILSRFCSIYVPLPIFRGRIINLHTYNINKQFSLVPHYGRRIEKLKTIILNEYLSDELTTIKSNMELSLTLYNQGFNSLDILELLRLYNKQKCSVFSPLNIIHDEHEADNKLKDEQNVFCALSHVQIITCLISFQKIRREIRQEKILLLWLLNSILLGLDVGLKI